MFTVSRVQSEILLQPTRWLQLQNNFQHFTLKQFSVYTVQIIPLPPCHNLPGPAFLLFCDQILHFIIECIEYSVSQSDVVVAAAAATENKWEVVTYSNISVVMQYSSLWGFEIKILICKLEGRVRDKSSWKLTNWFIWFVCGNW